jgi:RNA polymerase sigma-70 factor (ECF subfamily)
MAAETGQITLLLKQLSRGNRDAHSQLIPLVYSELKRLAVRYMRAERIGHTLQPTALVHEAYLRLVDQNGVDWQDRAHFFAAAAQVMRRVLIDYARQWQAEKRGGPNQVKMMLDEEIAFSKDRSSEFLAVDQVLDRLAALDPVQCQIVELRFFAGLTVEETAEVVRLSPRTVKREWKLAKAWLYSELAKGADALGP